MFYNMLFILIYRMIVVSLLCYKSIKITFMKTINGIIYIEKSSFMSHIFGKRTYFVAVHKCNGEEIFRNFCDAYKYLMNNQLIIKF